MSIDTSNDAEKAQIEILRQMSSSERLELALDLAAATCR
jgi:dephospho-CoA kinase